MGRLSSINNLLPRDVLFVFRGEKLKQLNLLLCVELSPESTTRHQLKETVSITIHEPGISGYTHVRPRLEPVHQAGLGVLNAVTISRQRSICHALVYNQLHVLDTAAEMCMEISCNGRIGNLVLLVGCVFGIGNV